MGYWDRKGNIPWDTEAEKVIIREYWERKCNYHGIIR